LRCVVHVDVVVIVARPFGLSFDLDMRKRPSATVST
jgi:hypothetical protein